MEILSYQFLFHSLLKQKVLFLHFIQDSKAAMEMPFGQLAFI